MDCNSLPETISQIMNQSGVPLAAYQRLVLIGHGGRRLWQALQAWGMKTADPVDYYTKSLTHQFIRDYLDNPPTLWLYPGTDTLIPLQQLGELVGWGHPSPLGLGINPVYGVWFAYRAAFLTTAALPLIHNTPSPSPCDSCADRPCIGACPVGAVQFGPFDVNGCVQHRLQERSSCADRCLARRACPFFSKHRYSLAQIQYHYGHSLQTLQERYDR